ncbi:DNA repair protein RecO [Candidatus Woesebacteria bacterium]|nr:DNA repair protein RecO [Candidatus Woesebacteria bacterium]
MSLRTATAIGLVLSHKKVGETDSLVTILTEARGKLVCRANGIRTLKSTKRSALQPGNVVSFQFTLTGKLPLLTQAILQEDCAQMDSTLPRMRQLSQLLELCQRLFVETELDDPVFTQILHLRSQIVHNRLRTTEVQTTFRSIITQLGYQDPTDSKYDSISDYVGALSDRPIKSYAFLSVK